MAVYSKRDFYRHARYVHAWLSAFAFVVLIFFAATGLMLNNPQWFKTSNSETNAEQVQVWPVTAAQAQGIKSSQNPSQTVLTLAAAQQPVIGRLQSSEVIDNEVMLRMESPAGRTDIWYDPVLQQLEVTQKTASPVSLLNELHRGKNTSAAWSWLIDVSAVTILLLSLAGLVLFLTLKGRLLSHVTLLLLSVVLLIVLIYGAV